MAKIIDKIVKSKNAPQSTNVLWDDGENLKIYRNGVWENTNSTEIKEGSIPMSALEDNVKELINSSVGFKEFNGYLSIDTPLEIQAYDGRDYYYVKTSDDVIKLNTDNGDETHIPVGPPFSIKYDITEYPKAKLSIITSYPDYHIDLKIPVFRGINDAEIFIPDTVIKTTPQTLTDDNKNQALANLGIADLLEALKPVRLSEFPPIGNVTQEQLDEIGLTKKVINNILNGYTRNINIHDTIYNIIWAFKADVEYGFTMCIYEFESNGMASVLTQFKILCVNGEYTVYSDEI